MYVYVHTVPCARQTHLKPKRAHPKKPFFLKAWTPALNPKPARPQNTTRQEILNPKTLTANRKALSPKPLNPKTLKQPPKP